ncbi:hypothetical protein SDC9_160862 [bioreactor metagenome]|uniref:Uncharacterized protein n=1 Tax=bioreactor metagenome TaxID=1076179 RepID=A0A645FGN9_9ZZZZ
MIEYHLNPNPSHEYHMKFYMFQLGQHNNHHFLVELQFHILDYQFLYLDLIKLLHCLLETYNHAHKSFHQHSTLHLYTLSVYEYKYHAVSL